MHYGKLSFVLLVVAVTILFNCEPAWSQTESGSISGTVTDATGAVIPGAMVSVKNTATSAERTVQSQSDGKYVIEGLLPGLYDITITSANFATFKSRAEVTVGGKVTVDAQLALGSTTTVVTVEVTGAGGATVNTQSQELSQLVDSTQMSQLPSLNRDPYDFVALSGNVSNADNTANGGTPNAITTKGQSMTGRGVGYQINGQRSTGTEILLDGAENIGIFVQSAGQPVPADSIQEFSIITNNYGPEYGRASGGIVNVDSKTGTNSYHGSAFDYNRVSALTSNTFANNLEGLPRGVYTRNNFGFDAGGPILKNKLFVFYSQEWVRVRSNSIQTNDILAPAFISLLPSNVQSFMDKFGTGALPATATPVTAGALVAAGVFGTTGTTPNPFPLINGVTAVPATTPVFDTVVFKAPFDAGGGVPQNTYNLLGRIDYNLSDRTTMFFRYAQYEETDQRGSVFYSAYPQYDTGGASWNYSPMYSINHVFSPTLTSVTKLSYTRFNTVTSFNQSLVNTPNMYFSTINYGQVSDPVTSNVIQLPGLENTNIGSGGLPAGGPQNTFQFIEDLGWSKGKHTMHFGGELTYIQLNYSYGAYAQSQQVMGSLLGDSLGNLVNAGGLTNAGVFASPLLQFTTRVNAEGALPCVTDIYGNPIVTPSCELTPPVPAADYARSYRYWDWALYAGDSFKMTRRLTVNYAVRYEHYGVQHNNHQDLDSNFYPGVGQPYPEGIRTGQVYQTQKSPVGGFWAPRWGTVAPRVGFAYDIFGDGKSSVRGGFGISYERNFGNVTYNASFNPPASAVPSSICSENAAGIIATCNQFVTLNNSGPFGVSGPPLPLSPVELRYMDPYINVAQTQFWSLAVERQLFPNAVLGVSYSGAHGVHLYDLNNVNLIGGGQALLGEPLVTTVAGAGGEQCPYSDPGNPDLNACYVRLNPQYSNINERGSYGSSSYNALNVNFKTQDLYHTGLTVIANYTWAHSLDDLSSTFSESLQAGSVGYTSFSHPLLDWGNSDFDIRNRFVLSPIWQTPWYKTGRGLAAQALGGWNLSGILTIRGGIPFSVYDESYLINFYTIPRLTPAYPITQYHTGTPILQPGQGNTFFALNVPPPAPIGPLDPALGISDFGPYPHDMSHRGVFRGPGAWNTDFAIGKNFRLTERFNMEFRTEMFNALNHANFYVNPDFNYYTAPTTTGLSIVDMKGGLGTAAEGGNHDERRFVQFSLRLSF
jgi:hypothetical protein